MHFAGMFPDGQSIFNIITVNTELQLHLSELELYQILRDTLENLRGWPSDEMMDQ